MLRNILVASFIIILSNISFGQCFIPDYSDSFCPDEIVLDLTQSQFATNGVYVYYENGIEVLNPTAYIPNGSVIFDGVYTQNGTGCVSEYKLFYTEVIFPEPELQEEYFLDCLVSEVSIDVNLPDANLFSFDWINPSGTYFASGEEVTIDATGTYTFQMRHNPSFCVVLTDFEMVLDNAIPSATTEVVLNCDSTANIVLTANANSNDLTLDWSGPGIVDVNNPFNILVNQSGTYQYAILNNSNGCSSLDSVTIDSLNCIDTNIDQLVFGDQIKIYPNPSEGRFQIDFSTTKMKGIEVLVFDVLGIKMPYEIGVNNNFNTQQIDLSTFPSGIYFVQLLIEGKSIFKKIEKM